MKNESSNREEELTLKSARLKLLCLASEDLINHDYIQCKDSLLVYVDTIPASSIAGKRLREEDSRLLTQYNDSMNIMQTNIDATRGGLFDPNIEVDPLRGLPITDYSREEVGKAQRRWARTFHAACWDCANEYDLIPSK